MEDGWCQSDRIPDFKVDKSHGTMGHESRSAATLTPISILSLLVDCIGDEAVI